MAKRLYGVVEQDDTGEVAEVRAAAYQTTVRPTKKQQELLQFIQAFIDKHGYSPSYREIMNGCQYTSVATVALHVGNLIKRGHIRKRDRSARSLEVVSPLSAGGQMHTDTSVADADEDQAGRWLERRADDLFAAAETQPALDRPCITGLESLVQAMEVLGFNDRAARFRRRLEALLAQGG